MEDHVIPVWCFLCLSAAMKRLHGTDNFDSELEDMERERVSAGGVKARKPWELFSDRSLRWQLLSIIIINCAQQLNGINAVRSPPTPTSLYPMSTCASLH